MRDLQVEGQPLGIAEAVGQLLGKVLLTGIGLEILIVHGGGL